MAFTNPKVRKGFIAALLKKRPEEIRETILLPTILRKESKNEKQGILDVRVLLEDGTQIDLEMQVAYFEYWEKRILFYLGKMYTDQIQKGEPYEKLKKCIHVSILDFVHFPEDEKCYRTIRLCDVEDGEEYTDLFELQILELSKLPEHVKSGEDIVQWMRFFNGKNQEEFETMAKENEYLDEAYQTLKEMSADEQKRLEYEAREKALKDYNSQMSSSLARGLKQGEEIGLKRGEEIGLKRGEEIGIKRGKEIGMKCGEEIGLKRGEKNGIQLAKRIFKLEQEGKSYEEIAEICGISTEQVEEILI